MRHMIKALSAIFCLAFLAGQAEAQSPAQVGVDKSTANGNVSVLNRSNTWVPFGQLKSSVFIGSQGVCEVDALHYTTLASALSACGGSTTYIIGSNQTISADTVVSGSNVTITCRAGVTLTLTAAGRISFNGAKSGIEGCRLAGPGAGVAALQMVLFQGGDDNFFRNNYVSGAGTSGGNGTIEIITGNNFTASGNTVTDTSDACIFLNVMGSSVTVSNFRAVNNTCDGGINAYTSGSSSNISEILIANNTMKTGTNSNQLFCVTVQQNGGNRPKNVTVSGNNCVTAGTTHGGYSLANIDVLSAAGNTFKATHTVTIAGYEIVQSNGSVSGNSADLGGSSSSGAGGVICNICSNMSINGNSVISFGTGLTNFGISVQVNATTPSASNVTINSNTVVFTASSQAKGISILCNIASATCNNYTIVGNTIVGDSTVNSIGIDVVPAASSTNDGIVIGPNNIRDVYMGARALSPATRVCYIAGLNNATVPTTWTGVVPACT